MTELPKKQNLQRAIDCNIRGNCIFAGLDRLRLAKLGRIQQRSIYPGGSMIFMEGENPEGVFCICSGRVKLSISSFDGRTIITGIAGSGDLIGINALILGKLHILTAEALEIAQLCFIKKDDFLSFLRRNSDVSLRLAKNLSNELYEAYSAVRDVTFKRSYERFVELLLKLCRSNCEVTPAGITLTIDLSRDELAEMIGTSTRTLTRVIMKLKYLGLIECRHRQIVVRNRIGLENILTSANQL
jgi:CRP-like cAMP-binding protein